MFAGDEILLAQTSNVLFKLKMHREIWLFKIICKVYL